MKECILSNLNYGTVPDWLMVLVTIITAIYIYKTLRSQTKVQKYQGKLMKLELTRYRESIMPKWKLEIVPIEKMPTVLIRSDYELNFKLTLIQGQAYQETLALEGYGIRYAKDYEKPLNLFFSNTNEEILIKGIVKDFLKVYDGNPVSVSAMTFTFKFCDVMNNHYQQSLSYVLYSDGSEKISNLNPFYLKDKKIP